MGARATISSNLEKLAGTRARWSLTRAFNSDWQSAMIRADVAECGAKLSS